MFYLWPLLLLLANLTAWCATFFALPGNWIIVALAVVYAWQVPDSAAPHLSWIGVAVAVGLAILGELLEFVTGAAATARQGGRKRGMLLAVVGAFLGSLAGGAVGIPIPLIGPIIGVLGGGALGAFLGAYAGEVGGERTHPERMLIGKSAFRGRLAGTAGKLVVGVIMVVLLTLDSFLDL